MLMYYNICTFYHAINGIPFQQIFCALHFKNLRCYSSVANKKAWSFLLLWPLPPLPEWTNSGSGLLSWTRRSSDESFHIATSYWLLGAFFKCRFKSEGIITSWISEPSLFRFPVNLILLAIIQKPFWTPKSQVIGQGSTRVQVSRGFMCSLCESPRTFAREQPLKLSLFFL